MDLLYLGVIALVIVVIVGWRLRGDHTDKRNILPPHLRSAQVLYIDDVKLNKIFRSQRFRIQGKPDAILRITPGTTVIVEYKSRHHGIYDSDVTQLIATAIAVRETYPDVHEGYVVLGSGKYKRIDLTASTGDLFRAIEGEVIATREAKSGKPPEYIPVVHKCKKCGVRYACARSLAN